MTGTYNGWKNHATWNTHNWLTGADEAVYWKAVEVAKGGNVRQAAQRVRLHCQDMWGARNPDGDSLAQVNWTEIAKALRE